ncbi:MAG: hypothetical protein VB111_09485 [Clostridiaceae bacterium]|nr:hypothetical protein [Clostridiaceae bacterium]
MITLSQLRQKLDALERDAELGCMAVRRSEDTAIWREAMKNNEILFSGGVNGRVRYENFHDIDFVEVR